MLLLVLSFLLDLFFLLVLLVLLVPLDRLILLVLWVRLVLFVLLFLMVLLILLNPFIMVLVSSCSLGFSGSPGPFVSYSSPNSPKSVSHGSLSSSGIKLFPVF